MMIIWFSGLIRGAIAFALSLKISSEVSPHKEALVSITLIIVLMTTIIMGGLMAAFAKLIGLSAEGSAPGSLPEAKAQSFIERESMLITGDQKTALERSDAGWLQKKWRHVDDKYIKKIFGGDLHKHKKKEKEGQSNKASDSYDLPEFGQKNSSNRRETQMQKFAEIAKQKEEENRNGKEEEKYVPQRYSD
mmetsp:Transcript_38834/g.38389  ORF Transcript_38834/g.38389 Transcript_38834/m.38389 type:complete len:191 (+) Transcript_38834:1143-1715(+)